MTGKTYIPWWRRELGDAVVSEREVFFGPNGLYQGTEIETEHAVLFAMGEDLMASISKMHREAMVWGVHVSRKHGRRRGYGIVWLGDRMHLTGRRSRICPNAKSTRLTCGSELVHHAVTGETFQQTWERKQMERKAS